MPIVYIDILVTLNWLIDFLLLSSVAYLLHTAVRRYRLVLGGLFGGLYACRILLPTLPFAVLLGADLVAAAIMVLIAMGRCRWPTFLKRLFLLLVASLLFSGMTSLLSFWWQDERLMVHNGEVYADISPLWLTVCTVVAYGAVRVWEWAVARRLPKGGECHLSIDDEGGKTRVRAMWDSGLHLREPFSGVPVVVAERRSVAGCLTEELKEAIDGRAVTARIRMIPYRTVGGNGLLPSFRPRSVTLQRLGEREKDITGVYVALCDTLGRGEYEALIGNDCWEGWERL